MQVLYQLSYSPAGNLGLPATAPRQCIGNRLLYDVRLGSGHRFRENTDIVLE